MINIRKLAAIDMAWLGSRVILAEYALGIVLPLFLGLVSVRGAGGERVLGLWLIGIAANYVPLFIYAVLIASGGTAKTEGQPEMVRAKRYGLQQVVILVPLLVVAMAIAQELHKPAQ